MVSDPGRAEAALTSLRELVRHVGHDLNNHLASIIVNLSLATGPSGADAERLTHAREALDAARDAAQLARQLFAASQVSDAPTTPPGRAAAPASSTPPPAGIPVANFGDTAGATSRASRPATATTPAATSAAHELAREVQAASPGPVNAAEPAAHGSLLVLEDDESVAAMMRDVLTHFGYEVAVTQSPEACVTVYDEARHAGQPFDLVVLDLTIRGGPRRGMDTLAALRLIDPDVRAVAHSGDPDAEIMKDPQRYGFAGAIRKPTPLAQLSRIMQRLMARDD